MARGVLVLDENLANLAKGLRERNIHVLTVPEQMDGPTSHGVCLSPITPSTS